MNITLKNMFYNKCIKYFLCFSFVALYLPLKINYGIPSNIRYILKISAILIIMFCFIVEMYYCLDFNLFLISYFLIALYTIIVTFLNKGNILAAIYHDGLIVSALIIFVMLMVKYDIIFMVKFISLYSFILIIINTIVIIFEILFNIPWQKVTIFWNVNYNYNYFILFIFPYTLLYWLKRKDFNIILLLIGYVLSIFDCIFHKCHTTDIALIVPLIVSIMIYRKILLKAILLLFNPFLSIFYNIVFFVIFVLNHSSLGMFVSNFITHRSSDFSGRVRIWSHGISEISRKLLGHGILDGYKIPSRNPDYFHHTFHNVIIQTGFDGGIFAVFLLIVILIIAAYYIVKINNIKIRLFVQTTYLMFMMRYQMASDSKTNFYLMLALLVFISRSINLYNNEKIEY